MRLIAMLRELRRQERGFTMVTVMTVMFCITLLSIAALSAAQNDLQPGAHDKSRKVAYAAAEAGVQNYVFHLTEDFDYWAKCTTGAPPHAINDPWNGTSPAVDPRTWMSIPGSTARYTIELLPVSGSACSTTDPATTMLDPNSGTFKIRATGEDRPNGVKRSIVATFKRRSLLDFLYFTDKETRPSELYAMAIPTRESHSDADPAIDLPGWAAANCNRYWGTDPAIGNRSAQQFSGVYVRQDRTEQHFTMACTEPGFNSLEHLSGPVHTNDELLVDCFDPPTFGGERAHAIETSSLGQPVVTPADPKGGFHTCPGTEPIVNFHAPGPEVAAGMWEPRSGQLQLPLTNAALLDDTDAAYRFKGTTKITMTGTSMRVTGTRENGTPLVNFDMAIPADGVVYVADDGSCDGYTPVDSAAPRPTCGNLELQGDYAANVTFTAENDIVVMEDVVRTVPTSTFMLGMIATKYIRVHHPVTGCDRTPDITCNNRGLNGCTNAVGTPDNISITAAMVSLTRSFIVDNWFCGEPLGTLTLFGAVAQSFHGPVYGRTRANTDAGYAKSYTYDPKLKYRSPPHFLDPVNAQWRVQTFSEQVPAR